MKKLYLIFIIITIIIFSYFLMMRFTKSVYKLKGTIACSTDGGALYILKIGKLFLKEKGFIGLKPSIIISHPNFSADGKEMAFAKQSTQKKGNLYTRNYTIAIFNLKQSKIVDEFSVQYMECGYPSWSPDGKKIAFLAGYNLVNGSEVIAEDGFLEYPSGNLYLYDVNLKEIRKISDVEAFRCRSSWLNNKELIFSSRNKEIIKINLEEKKEEKLKEIYGYAPSYCPVTKKIAIRAKENIYISNLDGTELKYLVTSYNRNIESLPSGYPTELTWSPDGKFLIYTRQGKCFDRMAVISDMIVVDVNNSKIKRKLHTGGGDFWGVSWSK